MCWREEHFLKFKRTIHCVRVSALFNRSPIFIFNCFSSDTGIINVYEAATTLINPSKNHPNPSNIKDGKSFRFDNELYAPKPLYTVSNLTTRIDYCKFSRDSQIMVFGSAVKVRIFFRC